MNNIIKRISNPTLDKRCNIFISIIYYSDGTKRKTTTVRALMEQHLNRKLTKDEFVIYLDDNSLNIELSNLKLITKEEFREHIEGKYKNYYQNSDKKSKAHPNLILDYFKEINTKDKAYWLGFLYADGCLSGTPYYRLRLGLKTADSDSIVKFVRDIGGNIDKIKTRTDVRSLKGQSPKEYSTTYISLNNKEFYSHLGVHDLTPNKTLTIKVPESIKTNSKEIIYSFIQGYFDGDGCLDKKSGAGDFCSGSREFLEDIKELLEVDNKIGKMKDSNTYYIRIPRTVLQKMNNIYPDSMSRKRIPSDRCIKSKKKNDSPFQGKPLIYYKNDLLTLDFKEFAKKYNCPEYYVSRLKKRLIKFNI